MTLLFAFINSPTKVRTLPLSVSVEGVTRQNMCTMVSAETTRTYLITVPKIKF